MSKEIDKFKLGIIEEEIRDYCHFGDERVYVLLAIARSKENKDISATDQPTMRRVVEDHDELEYKIKDLMHSVKEFDLNYRLYLTANARNVVDAFFILRQEMDHWMRNVYSGNKASHSNLKRIDHRWKSILQKKECRDDKRFIFDIDDASEEEMKEVLYNVEKYGDVIAELDTPNGYHILTEPFNYNELDIDVEYELKKDGLLFIEHI